MQGDVHSAHYRRDARALSINGRALVVAPNREAADAWLTKSGYELVGSWVPANLGWTRLVVDEVGWYRRGAVLPPDTTIADPADQARWIRRYIDEQYGEAGDTP